MISLTLNLATRLWYGRRRLHTVLSATVLFLLLLIIGGGLLVQNNAKDMQRLRNEIRSMDEQLTSQRGTILSQNELVQFNQKLELVNTLLERRSRQQWVQQLDDIEKLVPNGVVLTRLESDSSKGQGLILNGRCKSFTDLQRLIESLAKSSRFNEPVLVSHTKLQTPGQPDLLQFVVNVNSVSP